MSTTRQRAAVSVGAIGFLIWWFWPRGGAGEGPGGQWTTVAVTPPATTTVPDVAPQYTFPVLPPEPMDPWFLRPVPDPVSPGHYKVAEMILVSPYGQQELVTGWSDRMAPSLDLYYANLQRVVAKHGPLDALVIDAPHATNVFMNEHERIIAPFVAGGLSNIRFE